MAKYRGIYKRDNTPYWWMVYAHGDKVIRKSTKCKTAKEAARVRTRELAAIGKQEYDPTVKVPYLHEEIKRYMEQSEKRSKRRDDTSSKHLLPVFGSKRLDKITRGDVEAYKNQRKREKTQHGKTPANASINRELALLKTILNSPKRFGYKLKSWIVKKTFLYT